MPPIILFTERAEKCIADGIFGSLGSDGPTGSGASTQRQAFHRIRVANPLNIVEETNFPDDFNIIAPMTMQMFVEGDCAVLTPDRKAELWSDALKTAKKYWLDDPNLPKPFPADKFAEPATDCEGTRVIGLSETLQNQWEAAQK
ncbi:MAG: hypothetical protein ABJA67_00110 [Chthonomonadales bacterium]